MLQRYGTVVDPSLHAVSESRKAESLAQHTLGWEVAGLGCCGPPLALDTDYILSKNQGN